MTSPEFHIELVETFAFIMLWAAGMAWFYYFFFDEQPEPKKPVQIQEDSVDWKNEGF